MKVWQPGTKPLPVLCGLWRQQPCDGADDAVLLVPATGARHRLWQDRAPDMLGSAAASVLIACCLCVALVGLHLGAEPFREDGAKRLDLALGGAMLPAAQPACLPFFSSASCSAAFFALGRDPYRPPNMSRLFVESGSLQTSTSDSMK